MPVALVLPSLSRSAQWRCRTCDLGVGVALLVPASPAVPAATEKNQHNDENYEKCRCVHAALLCEAANLKHLPREKTNVDSGKECDCQSRTHNQHGAAQWTRP
jgi:hypothetical protein